MNRPFRHSRIIRFVMEEEREQSVLNQSQEGIEEVDNSLTLCEHAESPEDDRAEPEDTMTNMLLSNESRTSDKPKLKLIVRSQYWGRELKGKTCRNVYTNMNVKAPLVITSQAVLYNTDGFWGCCPTQGKRVLELQEYHFSDACEGCNWDLYLVGTWVSPSQAIHDFFLLPKDQTSVDIERNVRLNGWSYAGTCNADMIRSGIDEMLHGLLLQNDAFGHRYHHVHIDIMMDKAFDRETPRSRKLNNEKARSERKRNMDPISHNFERQGSSVTTEGSASTDQESPPPAASKASNANKSFATKIVGAAPPIPRLITNDSVPYLVPMAHSMPNPAVIYQDVGWAGEATHWNRIPPTPCLIASRPGQVGNVSEHQGMQWFPAKGMSLPGSMPPQHPYWNHSQGLPFATVAPQTYFHLPDMQMHQYHVGIQHAHPQHMATELQHGNIVYSENQHYAGMNTVDESSLFTDSTMACGEITEGNSIKFVPHTLADAPINDSGFPPSPPSASFTSVPLKTVDVSPVVATKTPSIALSSDPRESPRSSSTILGTAVGGSPVDATDSTDATAELHHIPTPSQLLITTSGDS